MTYFNDSQNSAYLLRLKNEINSTKLFRPLLGPIGPHMQCDGKEVITWCFNDYLGLANHPSNRAIEKDTINAVPINYPMGSRLLSGENDLYRELEQKFAAYLGKEDCMLFATGYLAAIGTIPALIKPNDCIILDAEAHACLFDAAKIAVANGGKLRVYRHNDAASLEQQLQLARRNPQAKIFIICDGVYSMSGELAILPDIIRLKKIYQAQLLLDDAHGGGVTGKAGRGTANYFNLSTEVDLILNTFSKAFGASGGCISGDAATINFLRYTARTNIFSHNLQLIFVKKILNSLALIQNDITRLEKLDHNINLLCTGMLERGITIGKTQSPIIPLIFKVTEPFKQVKKLVGLVLALREKFGIFVMPVTFPAVPADRFIIRFTVTANHSAEDIEITLAALDQLHQKGRLTL